MSDAQLQPIDAFRLTLALTYACNLRCAYCYVKPRSGQHLEAPVAAQAVDLALSRVRPGGVLHLAFLGGEPLLVPDRLEAVLARARHEARQQSKSLAAAVTTNGTLLSDETLDLLARGSVELTVSFDGVREAHDAMRRRSDGTGTHDAVLDGLRRAVARRMRPGVNLVTHPRTVSLLSAGVAEVASLGIERIDLGLDYGAAWSPESLRELARQYDAIAELYVTRWRQGAVLSLPFLEAKLAAAAAGGIPCRERCSFGLEELAVDPRGWLYPCERLLRDSGHEHLAVGRLPEGLALSRLEACRASCNQRPSTCATCSVAEYCAHWCACTNYLRTGSFSTPDGVVCAVEMAAIRAAERVMRSTFAPLGPVVSGGTAWVSPCP